MNRRLFLGAGLLGLAACSDDRVADDTWDGSVHPSARVAALERSSGARIGVVATRLRGRTYENRPDERFPMCSTFKVLAVATVLKKVGVGGLGARVRYSKADLLEYAPVTKKHVKTGMTLKALCDAAIRYSDNTAANLLLEQTGGPSSVTEFVRTWDRVTRLDRTEPELNTAVPGDPRDTTTPRNMAALLQHLVLDTGLPGPERDLLMGWMTRNTTGDAKIRAATPRGWPVADKTGSGGYGTSNDIAVIRPPQGLPLVMTIYTTYPTPDATPDPALVAKVARAVLTDLELV